MAEPAGNHPARAHRAGRLRWAGEGILGIVFLSLVALGPLVFGNAIAAGELPKDRQRALVHLLRHDCGSCHGMTLRGGLGPPLTAAALDGKSPRALEATILFGRPGTPMPPWAGMLTEDEVRWLVEALKSGSVP